MSAGGTFKPRQATTEPLWLRALLLSLALSFLALFLVLPLIIVFGEAFSKGWQVYVAAVTEPAAAHAIKLTLIAAAIAVPCNAIFGLAASWAIAKFQFRGRQFLITLIDLPIAVSPVIAGLSLMLIFGARGWWGEWLNEHDLQVMFAVPGIVLATIFITFPYVARELIPSLLTGFALAFARAIGEYGSVVFISGNMPFRTEITPLLIMSR